MDVLQVTVSVIILMVIEKERSIRSAVAAVFITLHHEQKCVASLKRGGRYIVVTYGQPDTRMDHYRRKKLHFDVEHRTIDKPVFSSDASPTSSYHVYVMTKTEDARPEEDAEEDDEEDDDFYDKFQATAAN